MTTRIAAIIGRPGTGKSSVVRNLMVRAASDWRAITIAPLLKAHKSDRAHITILGDYSDENEVFPGTDRLSMGVPPVALDWMQRPGLGAILFEGDRLGNVSTLRLLSLTPDVELRVWCLHVPEHELVRRYMLRGSAQSAQVLKARATKIANICANPNLHVRHHVNATTEQGASLVGELLDFLTR